MREDRWSAVKIDCVGELSEAGQRVSAMHDSLIVDDCGMASEVSEGGGDQRVASRESGIIRPKATWQLESHSATSGISLFLLAGDKPLSSISDRLQSNCSHGWICCCS